MFINIENILFLLRGVASLKRFFLGGGDLNPDNVLRFRRNSSESYWTCSQMQLHFKNNDWVLSWRYGVPSEPLAFLPFGPRSSEWEKAKVRRCEGKIAKMKERNNYRSDPLPSQIRTLAIAFFFSRSVNHSHII